MFKRKLALTVVLATLVCVYAACDVSSKNSNAKPPAAPAAAGAAVAAPTNNPPAAPAANAVVASSISEIEDITSDVHLHVQAHIVGPLMPVYMLQKCVMAASNVESCSDYLTLHCANGACTVAKDASIAIDSVTINMVHSDASDSVVSGIDIFDMSSKSLDNCTAVEITGYQDDKKSGPSDSMYTATPNAKGC